MQQSDHKGFHQQEEQNKTKNSANFDQCMTTLHSKSSVHKLLLYIYNILQLCYIIAGLHGKALSFLNYLTWVSMIQTNSSW